MLVTILLSCVASSVYSFEALYNRNNTKNYVLKKRWVQNFISFEYVFDGKQGKPKIVPIGCVPTNKEGGKLLLAGEQFIGHDFVFSCEKGEDGVFNYEAIACVDAVGNRMAIGETRRRSNGTVVLHCNIFGGALKKVVERAAGCYFNETIFNEDQLWIEPLKNRSSASPLTGKLMQCFRPHFSYYESHVIGCAIGKLGIRLEEFAQVANGFVQCREEEPGAVALYPVSVDALSCRLDNATFPHEANFGRLLKTGCLIGGQTVSIGQEVNISNGCVFLCHPQSNVYICDKKLADFEIVDGDSDPRRSSL